jgi:hypothetical protein
MSRKLFISLEESETLEELEYKREMLMHGVDLFDYYKKTCKNCGGAVTSTRGENGVTYGKTCYHCDIRMIEYPTGDIPRQDNYKPVYVTMNDKRVMVITDGNGHAYKTYTKDNYAYQDKPKIENWINPNEYKFDRFLRGMDF